MSYNLLNYPGSDTTTRNPHYRTIFESIQPDILVVQEMQSQAGVTGFLTNVLNVFSRKDMPPGYSLTDRILTGQFFINQIISLSSATHQFQQR
jgi:hypothetical protein